MHVDVGTLVSRRGVRLDTYGNSGQLSGCGGGWLIQQTNVPRSMRNGICLRVQERARMNYLVILGGVNSSKCVQGRVARNYGGSPHLGQR